MIQTLKTNVIIKINDTNTKHKCYRIMCCNNKLFAQWKLYNVTELYVARINYALNESYIMLQNYMLQE